MFLLPFLLCPLQLSCPNPFIKIHCQHPADVLQHHPFVTPSLPLDTTSSAISGVIIFIIHRPAAQEWSPNVSHQTLTEHSWEHHDEAGNSTGVPPQLAADALCLTPAIPHPSTPTSSTCELHSKPWLDVHYNTHYCTCDLVYPLLHHPSSRMAGLLQTSKTLTGASGLREAVISTSVNSSGVTVRCSHDNNAVSRTVSRREAAITALVAGVVSPWVLSEKYASAIVLEDDGDEELIEKLKQGRKVKTEKRLVRGEYKAEEGVWASEWIGELFVGFVRSSSDGNARRT